MTDQEIKDYVYNSLKGNVSVGDVVFHPSNRVCWNLIEIKENNGICELNGEIIKFPIYELCDINKVVPEVRRLAYERNWGELNTSLNRNN